MFVKLQIVVKLKEKFQKISYFKENLNNKRMVY